MFLEWLCLALFNFGYKSARKSAIKITECSFLIWGVAGFSHECFVEFVLTVIYSPRPVT